MERFYGFDLGDAESAVTRIIKAEGDVPQVIPVQEAGSFITAYAMKRDGQLLIGEGACYDPDVLVRKLRFKSRFLTDPAVKGDIKSFAAGVLGELLLSGDLVRGDNQCFYVGCPAGWNKADREEYRGIFESAGYPPLKIVSESRAALVSACRSKHLQVGYDILSRPVLVVDIGSSTTDFAYIMSGREVELKTAGEVALGGGIMDEILLEEAIEDSPDPSKIRKIFQENEAWRTYCEFAARRLKEKYYSDVEYWQKEKLTQTVSIRTQLLPVRLKLTMNAQIADKLLNKKVDRLGGKSFRRVFTDSLKQVRDAITDRQPELIFMTGGVSRMQELRDWCREVFPEAVVICGSEPEFSVAKGLAQCGLIDEDLLAFKAEIAELIASTKIEEIVKQHIDGLYRSTVDNIVEPILEQVAIPAVDRWRDGSIARLEELDEVLEKDIDEYLHSDEGRDHLAQSVSTWLKKVSYSLEEHTMPICVRHNVPYTALSLTSYLSASDIDIHVEVKGLFAIEEITWLIDAIVSVIVGLLCGGGGLALIASGIQGILIGFVVSALVLALGREKMQDAFLKMNLPRPMRRLLPKSYLRSRADRISGDIKASLFEKLEQEENEDITEKLVNDISGQIEHCLTKMAEVVEIPLG
ncbi:MAG: Hsp70 family protein [Oscillospiraceae bacterium]|nr:Hsp70 family protein [Oscillospiraceae bacterium]